MQDPAGAPSLRSITAGCGRLLGDRRLRPQPNHQALKCPRCDSLNTKFCYYNNYNLSQPRHFCKSCRRYWTKGGVLRNVPVGGGCRKTKRSKTKAASEDRPRKQSSSAGKASSRSSSDTSSFTATDASSSSVSVTPAIRPLTDTSPLAPSPLAPPRLPSPPPLPPPPPSVSLIDQILSFPQPRLFSNPNPNPTVLESSGLLDIPSDGLRAGAFFPETGSFTSLIAGNFAATLPSAGIGAGLGLNFSGFPFKSHHQKIDELPTVGQEPAELPPPTIDDLTSLHGRLAPLEWQAHGEPPPALFDLPNTVDPSYWGQNQWADHDHHPLYLP